MSGDQIVGVVAIAAMLILVLPRLLRSGTPKPQLIRMALIWMGIIAAITIIVTLLNR